MRSKNSAEFRLMPVSHSDEAVCSGRAHESKERGHGRGEVEMLRHQDRLDAALGRHRHRPDRPTPGARLPGPATGYLMMFGIFGRAKRPPLTEFCMRLSEGENLVKSANAMYADNSSSAIDRQAIPLALVTMAAAGDFVTNFRWEKAMWEDSHRFLRRTNLDVITAEAVAWIFFLMRNFCENDLKTQSDMMRTGRYDAYSDPLLDIGQNTFPTAREIVLSMIERQTGFNFNKTVMTRRRRYQEAMASGEDVASVFASILLHSVGRQSLADPMKDLGRVPLIAEWSPLSLSVRPESS
jgi:hypothetical protein